MDTLQDRMNFAEWRLKEETTKYLHFGWPMNRKSASIFKWFTDNFGVWLSSRFDRTVGT